MSQESLDDLKYELELKNAEIDELSMELESKNEEINKLKLYSTKLKYEKKNLEDNVQFSLVPDDGTINSLSSTLSPNKTLSIMNNIEIRKYNNENKIKFFNYNEFISKIEDE